MGGLASLKEKSWPRFLLYHRNDNFTPRGASVVVLLRLRRSQEGCKRGVPIFPGQGSPVV